MDLVRLAWTHDRAFRRHLPYSMLQLSLTVQYGSVAQWYLLDSKALIIFQIFFSDTTKYSYNAGTESGLYIHYLELSDEGYYGVKINFDNSAEVFHHTVYLVIVGKWSHVFDFYLISESTYHILMIINDQINERSFLWFCFGTCSIKLSLKNISKNVWTWYIENFSFYFLVQRYLLLWYWYSVLFLFIIWN